MAQRAKVRPAGDGHRTPSGPASSAPGTLYIVATPIGNLEDITLRALRVLKEADIIAAEDTRHSRTLLTHFGISRPLVSYYDHNHQVRGGQILTSLAEGKDVALISDAGTPGISDPGYQLVREAAAAGIRVVPIPGPCAAIAALSAAGLPTDSFTFIGFLPSRAAQRRERIARIRHEPRVVILYEAPRRVAATLSDLAELLGERPAVMARELSKIHEELVRGTLPDLAARFESAEVRGEVVLLIGPADLPEDEGANCNDAEALLASLMDRGGITLKDAVKQVSLLTGVPRSRVYAVALTLRHEG